MESKPLLIIDGNNLAARCNFVMGNLTDDIGRPTGAIYGVLNCLKSYIATYKPEKICVFWDGGRSQWRKSLFPGYKSERTNKRQNSDEEVENYKLYIRQLDVLYELLKVHPVVNVKVPGWEADDLIGYSVLELFANHPNKIIISMDEDFTQLVDAHTRIFSPSKECIVDAKWVWDNWGVTPREALILKCLVGDSSDEIPGFPGIGIKTAVKIIRHLGGDSELKSTDLETYLSAEALDYYSTKNSMNSLLKNAEDLIRNFALINLAVGVEKLKEDKEAMSKIEEDLSRPLNFSSKDIWDGLARADMRKFLSNFMEYERAWSSMTRS